MSVKTKSPRWTDRAALDKAAACLRTIAHPHRLRMLEMLRCDKYTVGELAAACNIRSHVASEHLRLMQRCGLLDCHKDGRKAFYAIAEPCLEHLLDCIAARFGT